MHRILKITHYDYDIVWTYFAVKLPEGCTENPYQRVAVTILACFCTDQELVSDAAMYDITTCILFPIANAKVIHPQITSKIPTFNNFILEQRCTLSNNARQKECTISPDYTVL